MFPDASSTYVVEFREYMKSGGKENKETKHLKATFAALVVSSAKCRHVFRVMNAILTKQRASHVLDTVSTNLFIYIVGLLLRVICGK